jgi:hypothetical protein
MRRAKTPPHYSPVQSGCSFIVLLLLAAFTRVLKREGGTTFAKVEVRPTPTPRPLLLQWRGATPAL